MTVRPYILYGLTARGTLELSAEQLLQSWLDAWEITVDREASVTIPDGEAMQSDSSEPALCYGSATERWLLFAAGKGLLEGIGSLLLHDGRIRPRQGAVEDGLAGDIVMQALADLASRFMQSDVPAEFAFRSTIGQFIPPEMSRPGSGIVRLMLVMGDCTAEVWLSPLVAQSLAVSEITEEHDFDRHSLTPASRALGSQRVPLQVILGNAELTLDALCSLQVGDVIRLDESLSEPLLVTVAESTAVACKGFLGQKNGNLAVQLDSMINI